MNPLIVFYLLISAIHSVPVAVITLSLQFDGPSHFFPIMLGQVNRGLRRMGISQFEELSHALNSDTKEYMAMFSLGACFMQLVTMALIIFATVFDIPLPFISNVELGLTTDVEQELLMFVVEVACVQLIPLIVLSLALYYEIPLPFMSTPSTNHAPPSNEITRWEQNSEDLPSVRLTRVEDSDNTFIYANCHDERLGELFKIVVCQGKEPGSKPQCFLYTDESTLEQINPAPVSVHQLNQMFSHGDNETTV